MELQMNLFIQLLMIVTLLASPSFVFAKTISQNLIPAKVMFRKSDKSSFNISRDGSKLAWLAPWKSRTNIYVKNLNSGEEKRLTSEVKRGIPAFFWIGNDRIGFILDKGGDENFKLYGVNVNTGEEKCYTPFDKVRASIIDDLEDDPEHVLISMNKRDKKSMDVYRLSLETGELKEIARNDGTIISWRTDFAGKLRLALSVVNNRHMILHRKNEKSKFQPFLLAPEGDDAVPLCFDFENKNIIVLTSINRDKKAYVLMSPDGHELKTIFSRTDVDVGGIIISKEKKKIQGFGYYTDKLHHKILDEDLKSVFTNLKAKFPGSTISFQDSDKLQNNLIFYIGSDVNPGAYYLYKTKLKKLEKLVEMRPWINKKLMSKMMPIHFMSRDGVTKLHGYLTLPCNGKRKKLPVVINPHGGPGARDVWGFSPEIQFLANRGYAVLQINFRGSTGYGKHFRDLGNKQWGLGYMQHDISDGVKWLIKGGIADPKRVAIYGASYGGYATLAGLTYTPELYACGTSYVGPSSLLTLLKSIPAYWEPLRKDLYRRVGNLNTEAEFLRSISPLFAVDKISAPLFVVQGARDPRVKKQESEQIVKALKNKNISVYYMLKENEGHGFHNEENQIEFYKYLEAFFAKYLGGKSLSTFDILKQIKE